MAEEKLYVVESYHHAVSHNGRASRGVIGAHQGGEKIYLHALPLSEADLKGLAPRVDEHGNRQSDRFAPPRVEEFWVALDGEVLWPKLGRVKVRSGAQIRGARVEPTPLTAAEFDALRKAGFEV